MDDGPEHVTTTEARGGTTPKMTRYVLGWGLGLLALGLLALVSGLPVAEVRRRRAASGH